MITPQESKTHQERLNELKKRLENLFDPSDLDNSIWKPVTTTKFQSAVNFDEG
jgi:hypothetical protein